MSNKSFYAQHQDLLKESIIEAQKRFKNLRLFPAQVGNFYVKRFTDKSHYTFEGPYKIGTVGQADLQGWISVPLKDLNKFLNPDDLVALKVEVEIKSGKTKIVKGSKQDVWQKFCIKMGVIHIVATHKKEIGDKLNEIFKRRNES